MKIKLQNRGEWHRWFAWHPCRIGYEFVWFEWVERRVEADQWSYRWPSAK